MNFNELFDAWAPVYDETVYDTDNEYKEVFENYTGILKEISRLSSENRRGLTLEIGTGTGNLALQLIEDGHRVICIEPSQEMRLVAEQKLPSSVILDGHFLKLPIDFRVDNIVTSYAFHHLTYDEKGKSIKYLDSFLKENGKIIIADTMFSSPQYKDALLEYVKDTQALNLLKDLNTEYYEYLDDIFTLFKDLNYSLDYKQMNRYVWIITATKKTTS